ncbi:protein distal antenna [Leptopilina boulardi]|uniref:protein distal antenna n=1 Tax=Leptopilina boulardi TaxID=63433 RepID=UPI0021F61932|nr:protein distal antenna [Leptopilina boulardi]
MKDNRVTMRAETARPGKRPLRALSAAEKMEAIQRVHDGESKASVARDIGVPESTLRGWCKSEHKIRGMARNSSTPDSEAHSPASSSGAVNITNSNSQIGGGTSHSSEDEGPIQKRIKTEHQLSALDATITDNGDASTKIDQKKFDYLGLMSMAAAGMRSDSSALLLQHLGMMSQSAKNYMMSTGLTPTVGLVENGLQYTKTATPTTTNNKRHSICAIAPTQLDSMVKSVSRKSLPPAAEAPATHVPASPNVQLTNPLHLSQVPMSNHQLSTTMVNQLSNSMTSQLTNQLANPMTSQLANSMSTQLSNQLISQLSNQINNQLPKHINNEKKTNNNNNNEINAKKMDEALWLWLTQQQQIIGQQSTPFNPASQEGSWFWTWYKHYGVVPPTSLHPTPLTTNSTTTTTATTTTTPRGPTPVPQNNTLPRRSPTKAKAMLDSVLCNNNNESVKKLFNYDDELENDVDVPHTTEEAIEHGEKFFKWLDKCSDPAVTRVQVFQFRMMLDKLKDCKKKRASPSLKQSRK